MPALYKAALQSCRECLPAAVRQKGKSKKKKKKRKTKLRGVGGGEEEYHLFHGG